jgi:hypothetical protein
MKGGRVFSNAMLLSTLCTAWLMLTVEELLRSYGAKEFTRYFCEGCRSDGNRFSRYLEMTVSMMGGRRRLVLIPEGCEGWGCSQFSSESRKVKTFFDYGLGSTVVVKCSGNTSEAEKKTGSGMGLASRNYLHPKGFEP